MQSDTIIGIAGAVVLVAVMVGVFAYEYNNAPVDDEDPDNGGGSDEERMAAFRAAYPSLNATDDIDGDTTPNWEDDDIDDDGTPNAQDNLTEVVIPLDASAPAHTNPSGAAPAHETQFWIGSGNRHTHILIEYSTASGVPMVNPFRLSGTVEGDDISGCTDADGSGQCEITHASEARAGEYTLEVRQTQPNPNELPYTGEIRITY